MTKPTTAKPFVPPSVEQVREYAASRGFPTFDAKQFVDYYAAGGWHDARGHAVKNWKQKFIAVWEKGLQKPQAAPVASPSARLCRCGCGRPATEIVGNAAFATANCRRRILGW